MEEKKKEIINPDILSCDVFISWTGKDEPLKDQIVQYLDAHYIQCVESTSECSGNFDQWSRNAVHKCSVFLLLFTSNTLNKANTAASDPTATDYVGLEIAEYKALYGDDSNRFLPLCTNQSIYDQDPWGLPAYASACWLGNETRVSEKVLEEILHKVQNLIIRHLHRVYRQAIHPDYIKLVPLYKPNDSENKKFDFARLYIPRTLTRVDDHQAVVQPHIQLTAEDIGNDVLFISGSAGSGKSRYLEQLQQSLPESILPIVIPCSRLSQAKGCTLTDVMYDIFKQRCGYRCFYTRRHFESLLTCGIHVLLILDGMDEIPNAKETNIFVDNIETELAKGGNLLNYTLLFTSRNPGDARRIAIGGKTVCRYRLDPLTDENVRHLSQNLFVLFNTPQKNDDFYLQLADLDQEIRTNPLLLSQLAIIYREQGKLPQTAVDIYDAIFSICLEQDSYAHVQVPSVLEDIVSKKRLPRLLKKFSRMRYESLSRGEHEDILDIFGCILEDQYDCDEAMDIAEALVAYLQNRAIMVEDEFYHKMFLEYFTAVNFYDSAYGLQKKLINSDAVADLFSHYSDPYWSSVIKLFLVKADSLIDTQATQNLYRHLMPLCGDELTLLFDTCRELLRHKDTVEFVLTEHILLSSVNGTYPAYGPLFWYVPEYDLYETALLVLAQQTDSADYSKMLALTRDVCFIFGQKNTVSDITGQVDPAALWQKAKLTGVRRALCQIFCTGSTDFDGGADIYPRCFNVAEAKAFLQSDCGIEGFMSVPFDDELELYSHDCVPMLNNEYIGFAALPYDREKVAQALSEGEYAQFSCDKLRGLALSPGEDTELKHLIFDSAQLEVCYVPENISYALYDWDDNMSLRQFVKIEYYFPRLKFIQYIRFGLRGLTTLDCATFSGRDSIRNLIVPPSVTYIESCAFENCRNLTSVTFTSPEVEIENDAFKNTPLQTVNFAEGMVYIDGFFECTKLQQVVLPQSATTICGEAFSGCSSLTQITLPAKLESISANAFARTGLRSIVIPDTVQSLGNGVFFRCHQLQQVTLPAGLTEIPDGAFFACQKLSSVTIPSTVTRIGRKAFWNCSGLTQMDLPEGLQEIGANCFTDCSSLTSINIPSQVKKLGDWCFSLCPSLTQLQLPSHLQHRLKDIVSQPEEDKPETEEPQPETADKTLLILYKDAPEECPDGIPYDQVLRLQSDTVRANDVYACLEGVNRVVIGEGFTTIDDLAFFAYTSRADGEHSSDFFIGRSIEYIHLPQSLQIIGSLAFHGCNLRQIHIPDGVHTIGPTAFAKCPSLTEVHLPKGLNVLPMGVFSECASLQHIVLPENLQYIDDKVFSWCSSLKQITLPKGLKSLGADCFYNCACLESVSVPEGIKEIPESAFEGCTALQSVMLPKSLDTLSDSAFKGCPSVSALRIRSLFKHQLARKFPDADQQVLAQNTEFI